MSSVYEYNMVSQRVQVAVRCDNCMTEEKSFAGWFCFSSSHEGWGSDSHDSLESFDVCSPHCFFQILKREMPKLMRYSNVGAEIAGMPYLFSERLMKFIEAIMNGNPDQGVK